jgi:hypothetical protein
MTTVERSWLRALLLIPALAGCDPGVDLEPVADRTGVQKSATAEEVESARGNKNCRPDSRRFAVFSDPHFYDTALGTEGPAFAAYMAADRKMLVQSEAILAQVVDRIIEERPSFVLVPGDLTKDGEQQNHERFAGYLKTIERTGIDVYVVPGNHDVMNPDAFRYTPEGQEPVASVDEKEFRRIYHRFGYAQALDKDSASLSYLAEPAPGLWLLALDSTIHRENTPETGPITAGRLSPATRDWALAKLKLAKKHGKRVIGMMHHGLVEHYAGQTMLFPEYVIEDHAALAKALADAGLSIVFTGHFHANDVAVSTWENGSRLTDVETGSLVTSPSPFRLVDYSEREHTMAVTTEHVTTLPGQPDFAAWAAQFLDEGLRGLIIYQLTASGLVDTATAQMIAPVIAFALESHYAGDEPAAGALTQQVASLLQSSGTPAGMAWGTSLLSLHTDLAPADNNVDIDIGHRHQP